MPPRDNLAGGRSAVQKFAFKRRARWFGEELRHARHELEELRCAYDGLRTEIASLRREEAAYGRRRNFDDGPGGYAPIISATGRLISVEV